MHCSVRIALAIALLSPFAALAGPLTPPAGPITSTMKTLDSIEPRVCLNDMQGDEGATVIINSPGQYFLRADVRGGPGMHGIRIVTSGDVSIDLNGFSVIGVPGSIDGVNFELPQGAAPGSLAIRCGDGSCRSTINGWGRNGIRTDHVRCECSHLIAAGNGGDGFAHQHAEAVVHRDVVARDNGGNGVSVRHKGSGQATGRRQYTFRSCTSTSNGGDGFNIECPAGGFDLSFDDSSASDNGGSGIAATVFPGDASSDNRGRRIRVNRIEMARNANDGVRIDLPQSDSADISGSSVTCIGNGGNGWNNMAAIQAVDHRGHVTVLKACEFRWRPRCCPWSRQRP